MDQESLLRRVERLEARAEIGELVSAYAVACDEHDMDRLTGLFTADAVFDSPSGMMHAEGREAIAAMFVRMFRIRGPAYHWTHDRFVQFDDGDPAVATGLVLSHAETSPDGRTSLELIAALYKSAFTDTTVRAGEIGPGDPFYTAMHGDAPGWAPVVAEEVSA